MTKKKVNKSVKKKVEVKNKKKTKKTKSINVSLNITVNPKPKVKKNYLIMVLDESGSMYGIKQQAINSFNEQVQTVKKAKGNMEVAVSLVKFANEANIVFANEKVENVKELTDNYNPNGSTALYDGIGKALEMLKAQPDINDPETTVLMLIISDGEENASKFWNASKVAEELKALQATGRYTITYAGANQDLTKVSNTLNIPLGNMSGFQASAGGMSVNNSIRGKSTRDLYLNYSVGQSSTANFYHQDSTASATDSTDPNSK